MVSGEDRVRWLNGMVTNNTRDLRQDFGNYSFVLNAQGHIQGDLMAFQRGDFYRAGDRSGADCGHPRVSSSDSSSWMTWRLATSARLDFAWGGRTERGGSAEPEQDCYPEKQRPGQVLDGSWKGIGFSLVTRSN